MLSRIQTSLVTLASLAAAAPASAGDQLYVKTGASPGVAMGSALATGGDVNGDGFVDFAASAPDDFGLHGNTYVWSGRDGTQLHTWSFAKRSGKSITCDGDANDDGCDDVAISGDGFVRVRSGKTGGSLWATNLAGGVEDQVLFLGDVDFDNCDDLLVAEPSHTEQGAIETGAVHLLSGKTGALIETLYGGGLYQHFGSAIARAGDVNKDGRPDYLVYSKNDNGPNGSSVHVILGGYNLEIGYVQVPGTTPYFGSAIAGGKDFNLDGFDDFVVGDPAWSQSGNAGNGKIWVYSGKDRTILLQDAGAPGDHMGTAVAAMKDVNADGRPDYAVSAPGRDAIIDGVSMLGRVQVHSGQNGLVLKQWHGAMNTVESFGDSLAAADLNIDGTGDLLIGEPFALSAAGFPGQLTVRSGFAVTAEWSNWGFGFPGALGTPTLTLTQAPTLGAQTTLDLSNSRGAMIPGFLFVGWQPAAWQTGYGGTVYVNPMVVLPVTIPAVGMAVPFTISDSLVLGLTFYVQGFELDEFAAKGVSFTPGLRIKTGL